MEKDIFVTRAALPDYDKYCEMIKQIWDTHNLTNNGKLHQQLEQRLKTYLGVNNVSLFTNGHLALETALQALNLHGEVITTPFTFASTTHAIVRNGLTPVFCDINPIDYTIDTSKIEDLITDQTVAIMPVHVYGHICDVDKIREIAEKHHLKVIYDAAHAFSEKLDGVNVANFGDFSMFSFHATKVFNTIEGGALTYNDDQFKTVVERLKNFGIANPDTVDYVGGNAKMNEFQAAMGLCNLDDLPDNIEKRKECLLYYRQLLEDIKGIQLSPLKENIEYNYSYLPILVTDEYGLNRDQLCALLEEHHIHPRKYFYPLTNNMDCYPQYCAEKDTPIAYDISNRIMTLPLYPDLEKETIEKVYTLIKKGEK